jgi:hypothetical protein
MYITDNDFQIVIRAFILTLNQERERELGLRSLSVYTKLIFNQLYCLIAREKSARVLEKEREVWWFFSLLHKLDN